jgi:hypothetical protein
MQIRIKGTTPLRIHADPDPDQALPGLQIMRYTFVFLYADNQVLEKLWIRFIC